MLERTFAAVLVTATFSMASADCPTNIRQLPLTSLLTEPTTSVEEGKRPALEVDVGAAGGVRAEADEVYGTAGLEAEVRAHRYGLTSCASGDLIDAREGAVHTTASVQVPLLFTGATFGASFDRRVRLPLGTRAEFLREPLTRAAGQLSLAFADVELRAQRQRLLVIPMKAEFELAATDGALRDGRRLMRAESALLRYTNPRDELALLTVGLERTEQMASELELERVSPIAIAARRGAWSFDLDGGALWTRDRTRGYYLAALRRAWSWIEIEGRAERTAFMGAMAMPLIEDRASAATNVAGGGVTAAASVFAALTRPFDGGDAMRSTGARLTLSRPLGADLSARLDGEVANATSVESRVLLSIAWRKSYQRASSAR